ncbi:MAG TPA: patatin-like phospholipase family protein [Anaeromyxobacter sp.]|nr:patatin-like phospholipase family protein [Anaeromyxobacter sp.]
MSHLGLVLTGGGARSAYQVGALRALALMLPQGPLPFDVLAGISAGAINAVALGSGAEDFQGTTERLSKTWTGLTPDRIFRTGAIGLVRIGTRWILDLSAGGLIGKSGINYLLETGPLRELLEREIPLRRMRRHLRAGRLRGVAVSATSYHTGAGVTFFEGDGSIAQWRRSSRIGLRARLTVEHVMASAAIPIFFPPVRIGPTFYGDGCVRMPYPMSPALHMGADRILAISVRHLRRPDDTAAAQASDQAERMPVSEIVGVLLNAVFLDSLDSDHERLQRINRTLALVPHERIGRGEADVRLVPALVLRPSQDLGRMAADEYGRFPAMLRYLLRGIGATGQTGEDLLSYLAFEPIYIQRAMDLGFSDTMARRAEIEDFMGGAPVTGPQDVVAT